MALTDRIQGLSGDLALKTPCRVATTAAITLADLQTIDGVSLVAGDRVLVKNQAATTENGIYVASTGAWNRAADFDGSNDVVNGTQVLVTEGTASAGLFYTVSATNPVTPGSTAITFSSSATVAASAVAAAASANAAAESANQAAGYLAPVTSTSDTSVTIGTGDKSFYTEPGKLWVPGHPIKVAQTSDPAVNYMVGVVKSYNSSDGSLVVTVASVGGAGTIAAWTLSLQSSSTVSGGITTSGLTQSTSKLLGRTTLGTGAVEEITVGSGLSLAAGSLTCTVTAPVSSVVGQTGAVSAAQVMTALQAIDGSTSGLDADLLDGNHASAFATVSALAGYTPTDVGYGAVGDIALCYYSPTTTLANGATTSGANLGKVLSRGIDGTSGYIFTGYYGSALSGTWRNISGATLRAQDSAASAVGHFQRIS